MNTMQIVMRLLHVGLGVFWAGTIFFITFLLEPSVRALGPDGGKVMRALQERKLFVILPIVATFTILSGFYLVWTASGGFSSGWFGTSFGMTISTGMAATLVAYAVGMGFLRPTTSRMGALGARLGEISDPGERAAAAAEFEGLRNRARTFSRWVAFLLAISVVTMAVARYI